MNTRNKRKTHEFLSTEIININRKGSQVNHLTTAFIKIRWFDSVIQQLFKSHYATSKKSNTPPTCIFDYFKLIEL